MGNISGNIEKALRTTKSWVRFLSVLGFILTGLMAFTGIGMVVGWAFMANDANAMEQAPMLLGMAGIYMILALSYFLPSFFLTRYANAIGRLLISDAITDLESALQHQKTFWTFMGIMSLLLLIIMLLGVAAAIIIPLMNA